MTIIPWDKIATSKGKVTVQHGIKITLKMPSSNPHIEHSPFVVYWGEIGGQLAMEGASNITSAKRLLQEHVGIGKIAILKDAKGTELQRIEQEHKLYQVFNRGVLWNELDSLNKAIELAKGLEGAGGVVTVLKHPVKHNEKQIQIIEGEVMYETGRQAENIPVQTVEVISDSNIFKAAEYKRDESYEDEE